MTFIPGRGNNHQMKLLFWQQGFKFQIANNRIKFVISNKEFFSAESNWLKNNGSLPPCPDFL